MLVVEDGAEAVLEVTSHESIHQSAIEGLRGHTHNPVGFGNHMVPKLPGYDSQIANSSTLHGTTNPQSVCQIKSGDSTTHEPFNALPYFGALVRFWASAYFLRPLTFEESHA